MEEAKEALTSLGDTVREWILRSTSDPNIWLHVPYFMIYHLCGTKKKEHQYRLIISTVLSVVHPTAKYLQISNTHVKNNPWIEDVLSSLGSSVAPINAREQIVQRTTSQHHRKLL